MAPCTLLQCSWGGLYKGGALHTLTMFMGGGSYKGGALHTLTMFIGGGGGRTEEAPWDFPPPPPARVFKSFPTPEFEFHGVKIAVNVAL